MAHGCLLFPCPSLISCQALSSGIRETKSPQDECHEGRGGLGALRVLNGNMLLHRLVVVQHGKIEGLLQGTSRELDCYEKDKFCCPHKSKKTYLVSAGLINFHLFLLGNFGENQPFSCLQKVISLAKTGSLEEAG